MANQKKETQPKSDQEKFLDEFTDRYTDKNPREQAEAIVWACEQIVLAALVEQQGKKDK